MLGSILVCTVTSSVSLFEFNSMVITPLFFFNIHIHFRGLISNPVYSLTPFQSEVMQSANVNQETSR